MISHDYKTFMVHIDKCAGTSICNHFKALQRNPKSQLGHEKWNIYQENWPWGWENYFKFAFVRNPWDRVVSAYLCHIFMYEVQYNKYYDKSTMTEKWIKKTFKKQEFYRTEFKDFNHFLRDKKCCKSLSLVNTKFNPCYTFIYDEDMNCQVDFVGRYENLNEDMAYIQEKLGMSIEPIPHVNSTKSKRPHYSVFYNEENIEIVREIYKVDIELFGYEFERVVPYDHTLANTLDWVDKD